MINNQNRYRVSTKFTLIKVGLLIVLLSIIINFVREIRSETFNQKAIISLALGIIALIGIIYFSIHVRKPKMNIIKNDLSNSHIANKLFLC